MKVANKLNFSGKVFVCVGRAVAVCAAIVFGIAGATPSRAQAQAAKFIESNRLWHQRQHIIASASYCADNGNRRYI